MLKILFSGGLDKKWLILLRWLQTIGLINTPLHRSGWSSSQRIERSVCFSSFFSNGISLWPVIHRLWSIVLHACQSCSIAFMSSFVYSIPILIVWIFTVLFCSSHAQNRENIFGVLLKRCLVPSQTVCVNFVKLENLLLQTTTVFFGPTVMNE